MSAAGQHQSRGPGCPSDLGLQRLMVGDVNDVERQAMRGHLAGCARCAGRLAAFEEVPLPPLGELPAAASGAPARPADVRRAGRPFRRAPVAMAGALLAAAAVFVFVVRGRDDGGPGPADVRVKGDVALGVVVQRAGGQTERIASGAPLAAGDVVRFELAHAAPGHAAVVGLDARQTVSVYVPQDGNPLPAVAGPGTTLLPGAIRLDDAPGVERLFGLLCAEPISVEQIKQAARARLAAAAGRPEQVKTLGLPCAQASFLVTKAQRP